MTVVISHLAYLAISIAMTVWVANSLKKGGVVFLVDAFKGNREVAESINHLLVVGFYLINIGYICLTIEKGYHGAGPTTLADSIEVVSTKIGSVLMFLGCFHLFNIFIFSKFRKNSLLEMAEAPVSPAATYGTEVG